VLLFHVRFTGSGVMLAVLAVAAGVSCPDRSPLNTLNVISVK